MRDEFFGIVVWEPWQLIVSLIIFAVGAGLLKGADGSAVKSIVGAILAAIGLFSASTAIYISDLRWINNIVVVAGLLAIGIILLSSRKGWQMTAGVIAIILAVFAIDGVVPGDIRLKGVLGETFRDANRVWEDVFDPPSPRELNDRR